MPFKGPEAIVVLVIILLLFGAKKLPELAGSMGRSIREFRKASEEREQEETEAAERAASDTAAT